MPEPKLKDLIDQYEKGSTLLDVSTAMVKHVTAIEEVVKDPSATNAARVTDSLRSLVDAWELHLQACDPEAWEKAKAELERLQAEGALRK